MPAAYSVCLTYLPRTRRVRRPASIHAPQGKCAGHRLSRARLLKASDSDTVPTVQCNEAVHSDEVIAMRKPFTTVAVILFALIAVLHVLRVVYSWEVTIGNINIPMWASVLAAVVAALLAFMVKREADAGYA
jgi:hypothetical protein